MKWYENVLGLLCLLVITSMATLFIGAGIEIMFRDKPSNYNLIDVVKFENVDKFKVLDYRALKGIDRDKTGENDLSTYFLFDDVIVKSDYDTWRCLTRAAEEVKEGKRIENVFGIITIEGEQFLKLIKLNVIATGVIVLQ